MSLTNPNTPVSQQDLQDFYHKLVPYLGGSFGMIANKFSKGDMYSTDEKMIGQWIDGKPLYQKNVEVTPTSAGVQIATDVDTFIDAPIITRKYESGSSLIITNCGVDGAHSIAFKLMNNILYAVTVSPSKYSAGIAKIAIRYTKTTDSAISIGDDTDYSTEEKIVGTWIDGKPVYQRTFHLTNPTMNWTANSLGITADKVFLVNTCFQTGGNNAAMGGNSYYSTSSNMCSVFAYKEFSTNEVTIWIKNVGSTITDLYVTLQYTKTT